jgi:hypothetical protein
MDVVTSQSNLLFEIAFVFPPRTNLLEHMGQWAAEVHLVENEYVHIGELPEKSFLSNCEATYILFSDSVKSIFFLSLTSKDFFLATSLMDDIHSLYHLIDEVNRYSLFDFCVANIETTSYFTDTMISHDSPTQEMLEKSTFLGIATEKLATINVLPSHNLIKGKHTVLMYNTAVPPVYSESVYGKFRHSKSIKHIN